MVTEPLGPLALGLLLIPAIALRIAIRALYGRQRLPASDPLYGILSMASTMMFVVGGVSLLIGSFVAVIFLLPLLLFMIVVALMVIDRTRRMEHGALLSALAAAAEKGVPLPEAARAFADEMPSDTGIRSLVLAQNLERGRPLWESARTARLRMGTAVRLALRLGGALGLLGTAMRQQLNDAQQSDDSLRATIGRFFYLGLVLIVLLSISTFVMLKIVPVFERMFEEFELKLPAMTIALIDASNWMVNVGWILTAPLSLLLPVLMLAALLYFTGFFPRGIPGVWHLTRRYDGALIMRSLALTVRRGLPLHAALDLLAAQYPLMLGQGSLRGAAADVAAGAPCWEALRRRWLISSADAAVLAAAERTGNLPWALEQMADSALRRQGQRVQLFLSLAFPAAFVVVGGVVGFFVIALFLPLISLIQGLS